VGRREGGSEGGSVSSADLKEREGGRKRNSIEFTKGHVKTDRQTHATITIIIIITTKPSKQRVHTYEGGKEGGREGEADDSRNREMNESRKKAL
jgi:hypothetical protein